jgi:DNA-binding NtrC family response regulator
MTTRVPPALDEPPVLLVDEREADRTMLRQFLEGEGRRVLEAADQAAALQALTAHPAIVVTNLRLPDGDGLAVLRAAKAQDPELPVLIMTASANLPDAVTAMKEGALDFVATPIDRNYLLLVVARALANRRMAVENLLLREELGLRRGAPRIVGQDPRLRQVTMALQRAATTDMTVLLEGESGTGKELFARALHALSARAEFPFVAINCAAIPDQLLESEIFGYEKGAFTGATARKQGKFEVAHRGTLFLDEIGDLPLALQPKILRALEEKSFERVGGTNPLRVDVRIVAATNRNLRAAVASRQYREDLFFRLSVFPIAIPPLRERPGDIAVLARHFIERFCRDLKREPLVLSPDALERMREYSWPGNVRELQNCMERTVLLTPGDTIYARHLNLVPPPAPTRQPERDAWDEVDLSGSLAEVTRRVVGLVEARKVALALQESGGDRTRAAAVLEISYKLLLEKIKDYGLGA